MIQGNIWQEADPGPSWHQGVQEHQCEDGERSSDGSKSGPLGSRESWPRVHSVLGKSIPRSLTPHPYTHTDTPTLGTRYFWCASQSCTRHPSTDAHIHTRARAPCSLYPRVNIISFSDRWEGSDLVENEATNLHPYYTVIHTHLQTCIALSCTLLPRMTHFLSLHVKRDGWHRHSLFKRGNLQRRVI